MHDIKYCNTTRFRAQAHYDNNDYIMHITWYTLRQSFR